MWSPRPNPAPSPPFPLPLPYSWAYLSMSILGHTWAQVYLTAPGHFWREHRLPPRRSPGLSSAQPKNPRAGNLRPMNTRWGGGVIRSSREGCWPRRSNCHGISHKGKIHPSVRLPPLNVGFCCPLGDIFQTLLADRACADGVKPVGGKAGGGQVWTPGTGGSGKGRRSSPLGNSLSWAACGREPHGMAHCPIPSGLPRFCFSLSFVFLSLVF